MRSAPRRDRRGRSAHDRPGADGRESRQRATGMRPLLNWLRRRREGRAPPESDARALIDRVGHGGLIALASVTVSITMRGFEVRRGLDGRLRVDVPAFERDGVLHSVLEIPDDLSAAIGSAIQKALR